MLGVGFQPLEAYVLKTQFLAAVMREPKVNSSLNLKKVRTEGQVTASSNKN